MECPLHIRSDNGPEFKARGLSKCLADADAKRLTIEQGRFAAEERSSRGFSSKILDEFCA